MTGQIFADFSSASLLTAMNGYVVAKKTGGRRGALRFVWHDADLFVVCYCAAIDASLFAVFRITCKL